MSKILPSKAVVKDASIKESDLQRPKSTRDFFPRQSKRVQTKKK